jgi:uncharacterized protein YdaU (DUF1376 family)
VNYLTVFTGQQQKQIRQGKSMAKPPQIDIWMPLLIGDFRRDTYDMSPECGWMYLQLLMAIWQNDGQISSAEDDLANICRATRAQWDRNKVKLSRLFYVGQGFWMHNGMREQLERAKRVSEARRVAGKISSEKRWGKKPDLMRVIK